MPHVGSGEAPRFLPQVQALRAVAVLMVVAYHIGPTRITGGYVGVDVFFVISGYLMTAHILRSSEAGMGIGPGLRDFYTRRLRRILPASLFLLAVLTTFTLVAVQRTSWVSFFREFRASALFYENWSLASSSTDYLAAGNSNPVQHFWSLSVEEQFYVVWPLALLSIGVLAASAKRRALQTGFVAIVFAASLAFSVSYTQSDPPKAYFNTGTRLWEFAVGGLLASLGLIGRLGPRMSAVAGWVGIVVIAACSRLLTGDAKFPGYLALVPVLATAAVMLSADATRRWWSPSWLYSLAPVQYVGKISYSVYLWHFPLVVLVPLLRDEPLKPKVGAVIFVASIVLGDLSQRFVESPFRGGHAGAFSGAPRWRASMAQTVPLLLVLLAITVVVSSIEVHRVGGQQDRALAAYERFTDNPPSCYGAEVLDGVTPGCSQAITQIRGIVPDPIIASVGFEHDCLQGATRSELLMCPLGDRRGLKHVAIVGDSHATAYLPAIQALAISRGWRLDSYLKAGCMLTIDGPDEPCKAWNRNVLVALASSHYDIVIVSGRAQYGPGASASSVAKAATAVAAAWRAVERTGSVLVALRDSPQPVNAGRGKIPDCLDQHPTAAHACDLSRGPAERFELMSAAARIDRSAHLVDLEDGFCSATVCPAVVGGVLVYVDDNHITATYARSLVGLISENFNALGL